MEIPMTQQVTPQAPERAPRFVVDGSAAAALAFVLIVVAAGVVLFDHDPSLQNAPKTLSAAVAAADTNAFADISLSAKSAIVVDARDGTILYALNPDVQLPLASLTKVPLVLAVSEVLPPDAIITIPRDTAPKGSVERLAKGERWRVQDVIDFTLVASSNTGAEILAEAADEPLRARWRDAPQGKAALWRMNQLTKDLGLEHTYFLNVSGLDESPTLAGAYGSARDVARIFAYALSAYPAALSGTAEDGVRLVSTTGKGKTVAFNTNEAIDDIPGLIIGKTGMTDLAGGNLAIAFDVAPAHPVVAVVLGSTHAGRFNDMRLLTDRVRQTFSQE